MAGYEDDGAPAPQQVTAARDAYIVGRDLHVHQHVVAAVAGSWYRETVRDRFWVPLGDRDAEIAELAAFCVRPDGPGYTWWQADAYAGKTVLMANLVLEPPPKVRIVSFFITARIAGQDDREAFIDNVLEQLAALRQQPVPAVTPKTAPAVLSGMIEETSAWCQDQGERLVLVVDGLDEDTGVRGPQGSSIAALLPRHPPHGMRVIVCSRPSPEVPHDVPPGHPLRDHAIVRSLPPSRHALVIRDQAESELARLLEGAEPGYMVAPALGRRVVGLLVAARGPLAASDLAQLTATDPYLIERLLSRTVAARSFAQVRVRTRPGAPGTHAYVLGHQELAVTASLILKAELPGYLNDLLAWADAYRSGWPDDTPGYVLGGGFFELLVSLGDIASVTSLALDAARHERMYLRTGTDQPGISETVTALSRHLEADTATDLTAVGRLAVHRDFLRGQNRSMPTTLPAIWAKIGYHEHALDLARTIRYPRGRTEVLAEVAEGAAVGGDRAMAAQAAAEAEAAADIIDDTETLVPALTEVARAWAAAGQYTDAAEVATGAEEHTYRIEAPANRAFCLVLVAQAWAAAGDAARAAETATKAEGVVQDPDCQKSFVGSWALGLLAEFWAAAGHTEATRRIATMVAKVMSRDARLKACRALGKIGDAENAARIAADIERDDMEQYGARLSDQARDLKFRVWSLVGVARAWSAAGDGTRAAHAIAGAERTAATIGSPAERTEALTKICQALTETGDIEHAAQVASEAEDAARAVDDPAERAEALTEVCRALAEIGDTDHAALVGGDVELAVRAVHVPSEQAKELTKIGEVWVTADLAAETERVARTVKEEWPRADALAAAAKMWATIGDAQRAAAVVAEAEDTARGIQVAGQRDFTLATIAKTLLAVARAWRASGNEAAAVAAVEQAERIAAAGVPSLEFHEPLVEVVQALADAGKAADAERIARHGSAGDPWLRLQTLSRTVGAWMSAGSIAMALQTAAEAESSAYALDAGIVTPLTLAGVAARLAGVPEQSPCARLIAEAEQAVHWLEDWLQVPALREMAETLAEAGMAADAERIAGTIEDRADRAAALARVIQRLVDAGMTADAQRIADTTDSKGLQAVLLAASARALVVAGDGAGASEAALKALQVAGDIEDPPTWARVRVTAIGAWLAAGDDTRSAAAEHVPDGLDPRSKVEMLTEMAVTWAEAGHDGRAAQAALDAEEAISAIDDPFARAQSLAALIRSWTAIGDSTRAAGLTAAAEQASLAIDSAVSRCWALGSVARSLVAAGSLAEAERLISLDQSNARSLAVMEMVKELALTGMTAEAERITRTRDLTYLKAAALARVARGWAASGDAARAGQLAMEAERIARTMVMPSLQVELLTELAAAWASRGTWAAAADSAKAFRNRLAAEAERATLSIEDSEVRLMAQIDVAMGLGHSGWPEIAERIARTADAPLAQAAVLAALAQAWAAAGDTAQAARLAADADHITRTTAEGWRLSYVTAQVAEAWAAVGDARRAADAAAEAEQIARITDGLEERVGELVAVAKTLADAADAYTRARTAPAASPASPPFETAGAALPPDSSSGSPADNTPVSSPDFAHLMVTSAERLLSEALVLADWKTALPGLARLRPDIASAIVDQWILESNRHARTARLDITQSFAANGYSETLTPNLGASPLLFIQGPQSGLSGAARASSGTSAWSVSSPIVSGERPGSSTDVFPSSTCSPTRLTPIPARILPGQAGV